MIAPKTLLTIFVSFYLLHKFELTFPMALAQTSRPQLVEYKKLVNAISQ